MLVSAQSRDGSEQSREAQFLGARQSQRQTPVLCETELGGRVSG